MFLEFALSALFGVAIASAAGWLLWGRTVSALILERDTVRAERDAARVELSLLRAEKDRALADAADARARLAGAEATQRAAEQQAAAAVEQADTVRDELEHERRERIALQTRLAAIEAQAAEREQAINAQIEQLTEVRGQLAKDFEALAQAALRQNEQQFLRLANETMEKHRQGATSDLAKTRAELEALLVPVKDTLARYEKSIDEVEKSRIEAYSGLKTQIEFMLNDQQQLRQETSKLVHALKSAPKARGRWGEQQLRNVLEMAGLSSYVDFQTEVHVAATEEERARRPDAIIRLPGGRKLIVDAKTSLNAFLEAAETTDENARTGHLLAHARALKTHAEQLGRKDYWKQFGDSADFVVMFVPGEHFVTAALEVEPSLWEYAFERRVLIATPTNLIAIARTVSHVWQQEKLAEQAMEIGALGKELHKRLRVMGTRVLDLGKALDGTVKKYNEFVGSLERQVMPQARKFSELQFDESVEPLPAMEQSDSLVRMPERGRHLAFVPTADIAETDAGDGDGNDLAAVEATLNAADEAEAEDAAIARRAALRAALEQSVALERSGAK